ncbi:MAG TPA: hypothetical protein VGE04_01895 [Chloroflexia bacterium]|jgi:hypothetical protein
MSVLQSLRRNVREFYDQYPLAGCGTWAGVMVAGFILLLVLPPEVVDMLGFILSILSVCGSIFGSE